MRNRYNFRIKNNLLLATKGKIIFGFLMAIFALLSAWSVSKLVFDEMIATVDQVSMPDEKLSLVNRIFNNVSRLDQNQKYLALKPGIDNIFIKETQAIKFSLDTLTLLYANDSLQVKRIIAVKKLLAERNTQFMLYLNVRDSLLNTKSFSKELEKLNSIFAERNFQSDSAIYTTETKTATTTLKDEENKGFFAKLFGKKKSDSYKVVSEELKIRKDTLDQFAEDSILNSMKSSLEDIKNQQKSKSSKFVAKERNLASTSNELTLQMLAVLDEVRSEALAQVEKNGITARKVVNTGITQITLILIAFFILTVVLIYFILTDIGKSNRYRLALEKAKELADYNTHAKQRFLSNMSHEIRTPLQSIIGYSELIKNDKNPDGKAIEAIHLSASHLTYIVNELLDYSRIFSGKFSLKAEPFEFNELVREVELIMQPLASQKNLGFVIQNELNKPMWFSGDAFRLKQILYNLIGNAIKFTEQGTVKLYVDATEKQNGFLLNLKIEDTGIGIDEENLPTIFEEFDNGNFKNAKDLNSTGLGLSIVKQLIELHNGKIKVNSKLGRGTTVSVELSYQPAKEPLILQGNQPIKIQHRLTDKLVWVVDDDQLILDLCGIILQQNNVDHQTFNHPKNVVDYPGPTKLGFVLMDMRMPEIDGLTLFELLKQRLPADVKFYAITAQVLPLEQQEILSAGFNGIISKPFTEENLLGILVEDTVEFENLNTETIKKMTFGNKDQLNKVLKRFVEDCTTDIELLKQEILNENIDFCRLIVHRLAGRIGQIGYKGLAYELRRTEQKLQPNNAFNEELTAEINEELQKLRIFVNYIIKNDYSI